MKTLRRNVHKYLKVMKWVWLSKSEVGVIDGWCCVKVKTLFSGGGWVERKKV